MSEFYEYVITTRNYFCRNNLYSNISSLIYKLNFIYAVFLGFKKIYNLCAIIFLCSYSYSATDRDMIMLVTFRT